MNNVCFIRNRAMPNSPIVMTYGVCPSKANRVDVLHFFFFNSTKIINERS